ncbi:MAG: bifunctional UDP-N-acetylglucosamine diphosphorylase/glucosamine-1-phosphate N-acetyltransferase GlmU [Canibacter sp.]
MSDANATPLAVVILAAGKGTRMKSKLPKVLHRIGGRSLIEHVLDTANALQPEHVTAVVRHDRDRVAAAVTDFAPETIIVDQDDVPGTGRAVEQAVEALPNDFEGTVVVLSGDVPLITAEVLRDFIDSHQRNTRDMTMLSAVVDDPTGLGRILRDVSGSVTGIVEEKDATDEQRLVQEINGGIYAFERTALRDALQQIDTNNAQGEKYLTDAAARIFAGGGQVEAVATTDTWVIAGVNDRTQLAEAGRELNARTVRAHQRNGVAILSPETTFIDVQVRIGQDAEILPGTFLHGTTEIAEGAVVGPDTTIVNCSVGSEAWVRRSEAHDAIIHAGATVGPFSYIRPGTVLGKDGKIGAFVEAKNAKVGNGSKVPHLSYVGDIEIGEEANIGAGTIVANYDGVKKHTSIVGDGARVGSKNVLVSPVHVGAGAYTGAGAVVRKDVPAGALTLSVSPQRNIEGWVEQNRPETNSAKAAKRENGQ